MNDFINKTFCMDNLELLKQLPDNFIDLIYCDILYGTGKKFKDYQDLKCDRKIIEEHYIPRITEMYRVLKDTGSIYLQMDYRINHWIRIILDDIFGYDNFKNEIVWFYKTGGVNNKIFARKHDYILFYTKSNNWTFNSQKEKSFMMHKYGFKKSNFQIDLETGLQYSIVFLKDVWELSSLGSATMERTGYTSQKPKKLLERIIKASSNEGDLIADFYCGSGTSCVVAKELNRNYIGCDNNPKAIEITNERLDKLNIKLKQLLF